MKGSVGAGTAWPVNQPEPTHVLGGKNLPLPLRRPGHSPTRPAGHLSRRHLCTAT